MKRFLYLFLLCALSAQAQTFTNDLAAKRSDLIWMMRDLGPLPPDNWTNYAPYAFNGEEGVTNNLYHPMGQFWNIGYDNYELLMYDFNPGGYWVTADPGKANSNLFFINFGLHLTTEPGYANAYLSMDSDSYNAAGLKYDALAIVSGVDSAGDLLGYSISPGQSFSLGAYTGIYVYDLIQDTETPSFKVADYYFGLYPNFPPDPKLPTPQDTQAQSSGDAFYVNGVGTTNVIIGWVKEGVYRPGFALQPGHSSPLLYTYMQQYFDGAWKADDFSNPPRTTTLNWNGNYEIDTNNAIRTGLINPTGIFVPLEPGKQILTTLPLENGYTGEAPFYALQMQVDENRDGVLDSNDVTSASSSHVFWVNNDCDRATYSSLDDWDEQDIPTNATTVNDAQFVISQSRIPSLRDLEDYDRLHIRGLADLSRGLPVGQGYTVILRWKNILSGNPGIFVFESADTNGGSAYLTDPTTAAAQIYPTLYPTNITDPGPSSLAIGLVDTSYDSILINDSLGVPNDYFIYCGTSRGSGELAVSVYKNSTLIGETSVFLEIRDVKELYERWTLGDGNGGTPATTPTLVSDGLPAGASATYFNDSPSSRQNYILFVHGWNMSPFDKDAFAETAFKRLYWQGYTNRFGSLRWPTEYGFNDELFSASNPLTDPDNYDRSEFTAWRAGEGMRQHILNLDSRYGANKVYLLAHSMGNIVAGEALALNAEKYSGGQIVNTYVASQAAVPLDCYKPNGSDAVFQMPFYYQHPKQELIGALIAAWPTYGWIINYLNGPINWDSGTPNIYLGWLETNRVSCLRRVNFYNPHDWALSMEVWGFNQLLKPDTGGNPIYGYIGEQSSGIPIVGGGYAPAPYFIIPPLARTGTPILTGIWQQPGYFYADDGSIPRYLNFEFMQNDMYEAMAFAAEARSYPLGMLPDGLDEQLDLWNIWSPDTDPPDSVNGIYGSHKWHSAEFRSNIIRQGRYWRTLLGLNGFRIFLTQ